MSSPSSATPPASADATDNSNQHKDEIHVERVFAVMTAMTEYFASTWNTSDELHKLRSERLQLHYGWSLETIEKFKIGFDDGKVVAHLRERGVTREEILSTGAFRVDSYDHLLSRFEGRIVFPYVDEKSTTRYFTARETPLTPRWSKDGKDFTPKYIKLPVHKEAKDAETDDGISPLVQNVIWTTHDTPRKQAVGIIAEGVADAISAAQAGYAVRSPVTTTFKESDAEVIDALISGWDKAVLLPDMESNESGITGALKTAKKLIGKGRDIRIAILPCESIKAAAEARVEAVHRERLAEGKTATDEELRKVGDWKIDMNEFSARSAGCHVPVGT